MANPTSNFGWQMPTNTDLVKDLPADFEVFGQAVDTSLMDLKGGTTGQVLSKASNTDMDFTWTNVDPLTILDAKGDLITATAADTPARLASSGVNGNILTVDTSTATGLKWAAPAASGGMTLISETVASGLSSLSFSSIAGTYKQLYLVWSGITHSDTLTTFDIRLNNDSGSNYSTMQTRFINGGVSAADQVNTSLTCDTSFSTFGYRFNSTSSSKTANGYLIIDNYASSTKRKAYYGHWSFENTFGERNMMLLNGLYLSTSAITSLDVVRIAGTGTFSNITNTTIRLYGVS